MALRFFPPLPAVTWFRCTNQIFLQLQSEKSNTEHVKITQDNPAGWKWLPIESLLLISRWLSPSTLRTTLKGVLCGGKNFFWKPFILIVFPRFPTAAIRPLSPIKSPLPLDRLSAFHQLFISDLTDDAHQINSPSHLQRSWGLTKLGYTLLVLQTVLGLNWVRLGWGWSAEHGFTSYTLCWSSHLFSFSLEDGRQESWHGLIPRDFKNKSRNSNCIEKYSVKIRLKGRDGIYIFSFCLIKINSITALLKSWFRAVRSWLFFYSSSSDGLHITGLYSCTCCNTLLLLK